MDSTTKLPADAVLAIRLADADDTGDLADLARLAALDSARIAAGPTLLGLVDGTPYAAVEIDSGAVVADPFRHTIELVALLRARAERLRCATRPTGATPRGLRRRRVGRRMPRRRVTIAA